MGIIGSAFLGLTQVYGKLKNNVEFLNIDHYWWYDDAKYIEGLTAPAMKWIDTGTVGGEDLDYQGTQRGFISIESADGGYVDSSGDAWYRNTDVDLGDNNFSIRLWVQVNQDAGPSSPQILTYGKTSGGDAYIRLTHSETGGNDVILLRGTGVGMDDSVTTGTIEQDTWYMLTITGDQPSDEIKLYLDDVLVGTQAFDGVLANDFRLFNSPAGSTEFGGFTKFVAGYKRTLTLAEIKTAYQYDLANNFG